MDTEKIKILDQLRDCFEIVESARAEQSLSASESNALEIASLKIRNMERSVIKIMQLELIDSLTADANALKDITVKIRRSAEKLSHVAAVIEKAANVVESFIKIITAAAAAGLL